MDRRTQRLDTGRLGEDIAAQHLSERGYQILHRNLRLRIGELDIVAARPGELRFVEVRTVRTSYLASPVESVSVRKRRQVARVAQAYLARWPQPGVLVSCDVIGVRLHDGEATVEWVRDAFGEGGEAW
ncbi:MAG: hypothetical protein AMXMBFR64_25890 [Myxococcales bacterium]